MKIKFNIIASLYDYNPNLAAFMKVRVETSALFSPLWDVSIIHLFAPLQPDMWKKCLDCIDELLNILFENPDIFIGENIAEDSESLANTDQVLLAAFFFFSKPKN